MRRGLFLTLILVLGLLIFSGCEMADNPMETNTTNSSTELGIRSTDSESLNLIMFVVNPKSQGNLNFRFIYYNTDYFKFNSVSVNREVLPIVKVISTPQLYATQVVVNQKSIDYQETNLIKFDFDLGIYNVVLSCAMDFIGDTAGSIWDEVSLQLEIIDGILKADGYDMSWWGKCHNIASSSSN